MKKNITFTGSKREGLPGGANEVNMHMEGMMSIMGYRDDSPFRDQPYIDIHTPNGVIDMTDTSIPLMANGRLLPPNSGLHQFDSNVVREVPVKETGGEYIEMDLTEEEIEQYRKLGYKIEDPADQYQDGGDIISQYGWDYMKQGDQYLTRRTGTSDWITAKDNALSSIKANVYGETPPIVAGQPVYVPQGSDQPDDSVREIQQMLVNSGYNIGNFGEKGDGVDGVIGSQTQAALEAYNSGLSPSEFGATQIKTVSTDQGSNVYIKDPEVLGEGFLPILTGYGEEMCSKDGGCSYNVSKKLINLMDGKIDDVGKLWADDAWFNKDYMTKDGGALLYSTDERDYYKMPKVPKELYSKLQVGDYVQLNRPDTKSSYDFKKKKKRDLKNEGIEHMGFIIGKDEDGTPLVWHGSETGTAYVQRIDEDINLKDHDFHYQITSIVRNPKMKDLNEETAKKIQESSYYKPFDPNIKVVANKNATDTQKEAFGYVNDNMKKFKELGYDQNDVAMIGQLLVGGIMQNESEGNEGSGYWYRTFVKQPGAFIMKDMDLPSISTMGLVSGKTDYNKEASWGVYQIKSGQNFYDKEGKVNKLGEKLQFLGIEPDEIFDSVENQTIAGQLLLLDNYNKLRKDKNFDHETGLYKEKLPASYMLAKSWQAGSGWQNKDKYQKWIDSYDVTYSENALSAAAQNSSIDNGTYNLLSDFSHADAGKANYKIDQKIASGELPSDFKEQMMAQQQQMQAAYAKDPVGYRNNMLVQEMAENMPFAAESTGMYNPNYQEVPNFENSVFAPESKKIAKPFSSMPEEPRFEKSLPETVSPPRVDYGYQYPGVFRETPFKRTALPVRPIKGSTR